MIGVVGCVVPAAWAAVSARVVVPRVATGLQFAYARLHAAGLGVSVPSVVFGNGRIPVVLGFVPAPGARVTAGAVVRLRVRWRRRSGGSPARAGVVPRFVGRRASIVDGWARHGHVGLVLRLGPLRAGRAPTLLDNYVVVRQSTGAGRRTRKLTIWARQRTAAKPPRPLRYGSCEFPANATLLTQDGQAALAMVGTTSTGQWYGCASATGHVWSLGSAHWDSFDGGTGVSDLTLTGDTAGLELETLGGKYEPGLCNSTVTIVDLLTGKRNGVYNGACGSIDGLVVDQNGFAAWHADTGMPTSTALGDVACPSVSLCVATDAAGNVATASDPTGGYGAWTLTPNVGGGGIACPSVSLCVTVGASSIATSTTPTGGSGAWRVGQVPGPALGGSGLFDVSCPTSRLCVAVGDHSIATSTDPTAGAGTWTATTLPGNAELFGVSCPSASLCVATDGAYGGGLWTSTNPTGGASTWTATNVPGARNFLGSVSCPSVTLCVAVNFAAQIATSTNPAGGSATWRVANINAGFLSRLACPTTSLCISAGLSGLAWSTNPTGGPTAWSHASSPGAGLNGIACPSTTLCVAVSNTGHALTTTNPTGGLSAWTDALIDGPACALTTRCVSEQLYAFDDHGTRVLDTTGPGSGSAIANIALSGNQLTWTRNGAPNTATLN